MRFTCRWMSCYILRVMHGVDVSVSSKLDVRTAKSSTTRIITQTLPSAPRTSTVARRGVRMKRGFVLPVALVLSAVPTVVHVQQNAALPLANESVVLRTALATVRVTSIKGFVYPWALAILPDGDMLVTEQGRNTLRRIHQG